MRCPAFVEGFCPADYHMNEHHTEWWSEYYCTTCGHELKIKHDQARRVKPPDAAVSRPKSKVKERK